MKNEECPVHGGENVWSVMMADHTNKWICIPCLANAVADPYAENIFGESDDIERSRAVHILNVWNKGQRL